MAGVYNPAFRLIAKQFVAGFGCAETVNDKAILNHSKRTLSRLTYLLRNEAVAVKEMR